MKKHFTISTLSQAILFAIALPAMANEEVEILDEITISGGSMYRMGEVPVHQAKSAVAMSREELDKQAVNKVDEIARYQAGFANQVFGEDTNTNWFRVRGAEVSQAVDGLPTFSYGFFTPYVNSFGLEAVEITKGADAMTFGAAQSGGLINYVSKRPHKEQVGQGEFKLNIGNNAQYGFGADYTGQFAENARYRFVSYYGGKDGQWENTKNETLYIAPSFEFDLTERTRLTLLASYQRDHGVPSSNFLPAYGALVPAKSGYIDRSTNLGDPVNDTETNRQYSVGYELVHDFGNGVSINSSYRYGHKDNYHRASYAFSSVLDDGSVARGVIFNDGKAISHALDNHITWKTDVADWFKNSLVVGTDYRHNKVDTMYDPMGSGATTGSNIYNATVGYNQAQNPNPTHYQIKAQQLGFYLQNQSRFVDSVVLGLGVRHDRAKQSEHTSDQRVKQHHTSYSGSLMYETPFGLHPYFAYSEAFSLPVGISGEQSLYDPNITRQYEVGVKYLPTWLDGVMTVAGFRAKDTGAVIASRTTTGITTSSEDPIYRKGLEIQIDANLTTNWQATLAYTYTKSVTKATSADTANTAQVGLGEKFRNQYIPTSVLAAKTAYTFKDTIFDGLTLGAGIRYNGHSVATKSVWNSYSHARLPSATVVDLMAQYQFKNGWILQINADNVGDRRYVAACDSYCYYGAGRNVNANVSYKF